MKLLRINSTVTLQGGETKTGTIIRFKRDYSPFGNLDEVSQIAAEFDLFRSLEDMQANYDSLKFDSNFMPGNDLLSSCIIPIPTTQDIIDAGGIENIALAALKIKLEALELEIEVIEI